MSVEIIEGDALTVLKGMPAGSVQTCITSPPYFGLRDYGQEGQLGLEPTPDAYVARLVEVFGEVKRVLRDDGTLWLNLGDSYANTGNTAEQVASTVGTRKNDRNIFQPAKPMPPGTKPKDLLGIPWMVAFALRADGWYLRSEIIWAKPNPMPESVTDRPTKAHEQVFLLSKSARYYYDADAIREGIAPSQVGRVRADPVGGSSWRERQQHDAGGVYRSGGFGGLDGQDLWLAADACEGAAVEPGGDEVLDGAEAGFGVLAVGSSDLNGKDQVGGEAGEGFSAHGDTVPHAVSNSQGRNKRSVWTVATAPYPDAHFATFPPKLIEPMVLAGCPREACGVCGAPWEKQIETDNPSKPHQDHNATLGWARPHSNAQSSKSLHRQPGGVYSTAKVVGYGPTCDHDPTATVPGTVLDCFAGSGTTLQVAVANGRSAIGIELNPQYAELMRRRLVGVTPSMFDTEVAT